jgi:hypothetical protein
MFGGIPGMFDDPLGPLELPGIFEELASRGKSKSSTSSADSS